MIALRAEEIAALRHVVEVCEALRVPYQFSGGFAGNVHGSQWPLHDIDVDVDGDLRELAAAFAASVLAGPLRWDDEEFSADMLVLEIEGVRVEITAVQDFYLKRGEQRRAVEADLTRAERHAVGGVWCRVQPLADLLAYKRFLGRVADLRELEALAETKKTTP